MTKGRYIHKIQEVAAFASLLLPEAERNELRRRRATAHEVRRRFEMHHIAFYAWSQDNHWTNLHPMLKVEHRQHTKSDIGVIAKSKRIQRKQMEHAARLGKARHGGAGHGVAWQGKARKIPSRPFSKRVK